jgi:ribosomal protein L7/L12
MSNTEYLLQTAKEMFKAGNDIESILVFLKNGGCSKTQSIVAIKTINNMSLDEAKRSVHFSQAWKNMQESDENLNQNFYDVLEKENT